MDAWPIKSTGLPARATRSLRGARIATVGQLRRLSSGEISCIRGIGTGSLGPILDFLRSCESLQAGRLRFPSLRHLLLKCLDSFQFAVLCGRYGLTPDEPVPRSLDAVGRKHGVTRERIRQVEKEALDALSSVLAQSCLKPVQNVFVSFLRRHAGVISVDELGPLRRRAELAGFNPPAVLNLLCDLRGVPITRRGNSFLLIDPALAARCERRLHSVLHSLKKPQSIDEMAEHITPLLRSVPAETRQAMARRLLEEVPNVCATEDGRYFLFSRGAACLLADILRRHADPLHFRRMTREFNTAVRPDHRRGTGHVLDILRSSPLFLPAGNGHYRLKEPAPETVAGTIAP